MREFAKTQKIKKYFEIGRGGIEHVLLPEEGIVKPGHLVVGADSHTCTYGALGSLAIGVGSTDLVGVFLAGKIWLKVPPTIKIELIGKPKKYVSGKDIILKIISLLGTDGANYKVLEFSGEGVKNLSMASRFTMANMAIEAGAKTGIFPVDEKVIDYAQERGYKAEPLLPDNSAKYEKLYKFHLNEINLQVARPCLPSNSKDIQEIEKEKIKIDQVVIGSCTNGRLEDLRIAASIMKKSKVHENVRCIVIPGSQKVYYAALQEGLIETFIQSNCVVSPPTCGPCLGGHMGVLAKGERAVATTNRNFRGRMGHPESEIYLASLAVASASDLKGFICSPESL